MAGRGAEQEEESKPIHGIDLDTWVNSIMSGRTSPPLYCILHYSNRHCYFSHFIFVFIPYFLSGSIRGIVGARGDTIGHRLILFLPSHSSRVLSGDGLVGGNPTMNTPRLRRGGGMASSSNLFIFTCIGILI